MGEADYNVIVGEIVSAFGRRGEVKVWPVSDFPEHFGELEEVCVRRGSTGGRILRIEKARPHKGAVVVKFAGIDDISTAETLRGMELRISKRELMPLEENEYYIHDIIGLDVETTEGEHLGKVREILRSPAHDVYVTDRAMIPAVKEFITTIDLDRRKIVVRSVEGLIQE
ncbi:MAG TPA: ribosome maturation factor RimM [Armatimonadota bacterium]|nr:ribosome maturation factor RimM [Armatimonadota bacterium]